MIKRADNANVHRKLSFFTVRQLAHILYIQTAFTVPPRQSLIQRDSIPTIFIQFYLQEKKKRIETNGIVNFCLEIAQWLMNGIWDGWWHIQLRLMNCGRRQTFRLFYYYYYYCWVTVHVTGYNDGKCGHFASQPTKYIFLLRAANSRADKTENCAYTISKRSQLSRTQYCCQFTQPDCG